MIAVLEFRYEICVVAGVIAERSFGFEGHLAESNVDPVKGAYNARALANALLCCLLVPWTFCLIFYTGS